MNKEKLKALFTDHPHSIDESYLKHLFFGFFTSLRLIFSGVALMIHAFFPFVFVETASNCILSLNKRLQSRRRKSHRKELPH